MIVGIDLGTTFSVVAYVDDNGAPHVVTNRDGKNTTPSVVMFDDGEIIVGQQAKNNAQLDPMNVSQFVKRQMGNKDYYFETDDGSRYSAEDISARILKRICEDCESALGEKVDRAVITVPAYFSDAQRQATIDAGRIAGLDVMAVINEPTAAALAYGVTKEEHQRVMVYDLGGGTFDVTIIEINEGKVRVLATHGNRNLGGFDFDNRLINYAAKEFQERTGIDIEDDDEAMQVLRSRCEEAKIALSNSEKYRISISAQRCKPEKIEITRAKFEELIHSLILETEVSVDVALEESGLSARDIDKVLLVGGSTRIPAVRNFIAEKMKTNPSGELNPDEAVAVGAAIYANDLAKQKKDGNGAGGFCDGGAAGKTYSGTGAGSSTGTGEAQVPVIQDVNSHGLGVVISREDGRMGNSVIIPRNQPIPATASEVYATVADNQTEIQLQVTEGDDEDLSYVNVIGTAEIKINPHPAGSPVRVDLGYDQNGIVMGRVYDLVDNVFIGEIVIKRDANMSEEELQSKVQRIQNEELQ